jgi:flagellar protein FlaF
MIASVHHAYREIAADDGGNARAAERRAIARSIEMMRRAEANGPHSRDAVEALLFTHRLWAVLVEDLANPENRLPVKLRADLISIGLWIMREVEDVRNDGSRGFGALIETSSLILGGLD